MSELLNGLNDKELALFGDMATMTVDDLSDMPSFDPFPNGAHAVTIKFTPKVIKDKPAFIMTATYVEPAQLDEGEEATSKPGDTYDFMFGMSSEYGQGSLKEVLKVVREKTGLNDVLEAMEAVNDSAALIVTKKRPDRNDKDVIRCNLIKFDLI